jgi:hypothetical protein
MKTQKLAVHACACADNGGEKRNVLIVSVLLPITVNFAMRSKTHRRIDAPRVCVSKPVCFTWLLLPKRSWVMDRSKWDPTLTQGVTLFSLVPIVWESKPKLKGGWCKPNHQPIGGSDPNHQGIWSPPRAGLGPVRNPVL